MKLVRFHPKTLARILCFAATISLVPLSLLRAAPLPSSFGVWDRGETMDPQKYPYVRGTGCDAPWDEVEKQPGVYDWSGMDKAIENVFKNKESIYLSFEAGPKTPDWVYTKGVPKVETDDKRHQGKFPHYPYYLSAEYKMYYHRFITEVAKHIRSYPKDRQERIAFIQIKTGCTGDETPYKGKALNAKYELPKSSPEWRAFRLETFALYAKLFDQVEPKISLLFGNITGDGENEGEGKNPEEWKWVTTHITGAFGSKIGALSRGHHLSGERTTVGTWQRYLVDPKGLTAFARSEMDQTWTRPWYQLNVPLSFYWGAINALNSGQSIWDVTKGAMLVSKEQGFDYSFYFFNKYAGQIYPATATDAFCALHKGLDAADTKAYPEAQFGSASHGNVDRMLKITAEYSKYGARVDDKAALMMGQVQQRGDQSGFNDVGWDIWPDNYSRLLDQIEPDATSVPLWRVGGPITPTSPIYSRFARGFEHSSGKDALYFKLHEGFSQDAKPKVMSITVVWYDGQEGSTWRLDYDAGSPIMKTALSVTGKGDKKWHHEAVTLTDAVLRHGGTKGADLALVNTDEQDDIFSLVEVHRGEPELPALRPPTEVRAFPGYGKGTKYGKDGPSEEADKIGGDEKPARRKNKK
jgi:Beta-galactosidase